MDATVGFDDDLALALVDVGDVEAKCVDPDLGAAPQHGQQVGALAEFAGAVEDHDDLVAEVDPPAVADAVLLSGFHDVGQLLAEGVAAEVGNDDPAGDVGGVADIQVL